MVANASQSQRSELEPHSALAVAALGTARETTRNRFIVGEHIGPESGEDRRHEARCQRAYVSSRVAPDGSV